MWLTKFASSVPNLSQATGAFPNDIEAHRPYNVVSVRASLLEELPNGGSSGSVKLETVKQHGGEPINKKRIPGVLVILNISVVVERRFFLVTIISCFGLVRIVGVAEFCASLVFEPAANDFPGGTDNTHIRWTVPLWK